MFKQSAAIVTSCFALAAPVVAQETASTATEGVATESTLQAVTVTANKVEEKLQDVPQAVTLITGEALQEQGVRNIADLVREIPNLSSGFIYSNDVNFRGINSSMFTNANPVVIYLDGVPQSNRFAYDALLENIDRVEVLRGPQGSLYGKDAIGGVINIVTKTPGNHWSGQLGAEVGNQGGRDLTLSVSGPIVKDSLYVSFSGKAGKQHGWVRNSQPGMNTHADRSNEQRFNLGLLYKLSPETQFRLHASRDDATNYGVAGGAVPSGTDYTSLNRDLASRARFDQETVTKTLADAQSLAVQHKFGGITFDAIVTNKLVKIDGDYDEDWGVDPAFAGLRQFQHSTIGTQTQEFRLSGGKAGELRWVSGLYFEQDKYRNSRFGQHWIRSENAPVDIVMDAPSITKSGTQAWFGQFMLPVGPRLELSLGGRYQKIKKDFDVDVYNRPVGTNASAPAFSLNSSHSWSSFLPKAALSWELTPQWKSYVSVAKGYLPGGYNYFPSSAVESRNRFDPQTSINYEVGVRSDFGRLYLAASLFHMNIKDVHIFSCDAAGCVTSNAGKASSRGGELEASYLLNDKWELSGALGLVHATYDKHPTATVNGNKIEKTPAYTARLGLQYTAGNGFYGRVDVRGQGKRYFDPENTMMDGAYATVDLKAGYKTGPWEFYGYVRNLSDTSYRTTANTLSHGVTLVTFGEPRRFGIGVRYSF